MAGITFISILSTLVLVALAFFPINAKIFKSRSDRGDGQSFSRSRRNRKTSSERVIRQSDAPPSPFTNYRKHVAYDINDSDNDIIYDDPEL